MARADLLLSLVKANNRSDQETFRKAVEALIAEERGKNHHIVAEQLASALAENGSHPPKQVAHSLGEQPMNLLFEIQPKKQFGDLILPPIVRKACEEVIEEHHRADLLRAYNIEPRNRMLLTGPPGNGKTSVAEAVATAAMVPMFVVRYEGVIASYLGETASRLQHLFDFIRNRRCVLFFDEFDTIGKERGDEHETGEIKRVVSSLLLQIDRLPSHVLVVTATNHPELLDRAVWRRFQVRVTLPAPTRSAVEKWFDMFLSRTDLKLGLASRTIADKLSGASFAEVEEFALDVLRRHVLSLPDGDPRAIVRERLEQWGSRAKPQ